MVYRVLCCPPPFHNGIVPFLLDLDLDLTVLVRYFKYPEFLCIDKPLQGLQVGPVHAFEIVTFIENFPHNSSLFLVCRTIDQIAYQFCAIFCSDRAQPPGY